MENTVEVRIYCEQNYYETIVYINSEGEYYYVEGLNEGEKILPVSKEAFDKYTDALAKVKALNNEMKIIREFEGLCEGLFMAE
tara:strand:+ start:849 stop:1097 length:249 start_codon:yes stop_codon:yes gene_type:complete